MIRIETQRLVLVQPHLRHLPAFTAFKASDRAARIGWDEPEYLAWREFTSIAGHWQLYDCGPFVAETPDGRPVGTFGGWLQAGAEEPELKWTLWSDDDEGRGLAQEAASAARDWHLGDAGWTSAVSYINPANTRSAALARRLGCEKDGQEVYPSGTTVDVWRHPVRAA
ncbi:GNAT family N-acetyltransferase [Ponticoccus sp. SC2-23]|uniref:GNAT family N-acetyltransferase n=1 Tax=Alexandriicola marinus TaxID=2081710 RepID=UPI000FDB76CC|nr:GNAT family N-acetyltransferase [Alexandriicola marinus]MBM1220314.1 GNAT family N-acetyltransferase [Ponticoccus sp. SC6-9]MBM1225000.1 GNAT family N-acetyltransferase [Ponticoccus sp. SC6-15]MBM1228514.1 GNAT family N-acetyltransferase [Ponticoccus sp. SC6-38]MBM1233849.1 GNAT family N-acetyltransferase [Ponticoccus sp. SC6-45]MBM1239015.1 GNAT family N-acetyltransferase [Ponticoccus sp. SC6-49]MBM1242797.1 GNAT family N-acetyltransferase [Ponticoccus sp. SC2-64]MBM1247373.1 GNAT family